MFSTKSTGFLSFFNSQPQNGPFSDLKTYEIQVFKIKYTEKTQFLIKYCLRSEYFRKKYRYNWLM